MKIITVLCVLLFVGAVLCSDGVLLSDVVLKSSAGSPLQTIRAGTTVTIISILGSNAVIQYNGAKGNIDSVTLQVKEQTNTPTTRDEPIFTLSEPSVITETENQESQETPQLAEIESSTFSDNENGAHGNVNPDDDDDEQQPLPVVQPIVTPPVPTKVYTPPIKSSVPSKTSTAKPIVIQKTTTTTGAPALSFKDMFNKVAAATTAKMFTGFGPAVKRNNRALDITKMVNYAAKYALSANHACSTTAFKCSPYGYWGDESCKQKSYGGDCANFVSQVLLAGGHPKFTGGPSCRGKIHCGVEPGAAKLSVCVSKTYGWTLTPCAKNPKPPANLKIGDIVFTRRGRCNRNPQHAMVVTKIDSTGVYISAHSSNMLHYPLAKFAKSNWGYMQFALY